MGQCYNSVVVNAPADKVWQTIRNFHDMSWAAGVITSCEAIGDQPGDQIGAKRVLNQAFHETLLSLDDQEHTFSYSIDDGPEPVSKDSVRNYVGEVRVSAVTENNTSFVQWQSNYESAQDSAVADLCNPIYQALLGALKAHLA